ncbi:hypothetical protein KPL47_24280 [Clostridium estertheticum]|uniref:hypothetical protein n=1 Tax=Clostridium estertheticum TaxID=238834 RepID=UPI001C0C3E6B|nr:hypothetical protein [Clostridium estertheticum]MBU3179398.1 hypothetical protein [Clostridium estertheticum]
MDNYRFIASILTAATVIDTVKSPLEALVYIKLLTIIFDIFILFGIIIFKLNG